VEKTTTNTMPPDIENGEALQHTQRLAGIGTLTAGIAHELTNPINIITATCSNLISQMDEDSLTDEDLRHYAEMIEHSAWRCARLIRTLRQYTYLNGQEIAPCDLNKLVESALVLVSYEFERNYNINFELDLAEDLVPVPGDQNQLVQVLINLLINARDALPPEGGVIRLATGRMAEEPAQFITVSDTGRGINLDLMPRIFEPFVTDKSPEEGTGLGLSIATEIVQGHGGRLEARNNSEAGATFTIILPDQTFDT
jgi:two-component system NtrC family sensor kinase